MQSRKSVFCGLFLLAMMSQLPAWATDYSGTYTVGSGQFFASPKAAVDSLKAAGNSMIGPVTLNVYTGTYDGQVSINTLITGLNSTNRLVIQNAPGESPVITNTTGATGPTTGNGFYFYRYGKYVTIRGFEITNCKNSAIYVVATSALACSSLVIDSNYIHGTATAAAAKMVWLTYVRNSRISRNKIEASGETYACQPFYMTNCNIDTVVNNMMTSTQTGYTYYIAEAATSTTNDQWYFNSFCGIDVGAAIRLLGGTGCVLQNNIMYNGGEVSYNRAASFAAVTGLTSDYNIYYAPANDAIEISVGSTYYSLRGFQAAYPALDQNSYSFDPNFTSAVSPFNLHLGGPSVADSSGTPVPAVTTVDYDGNTRGTVKPDIGADEAIPTYTDVLLSYRPIYPKVGPGITFQLDYLSRSNTAPSSPTVYLTGGINPSYAMTDPGGTYSRGVRLTTFQTPAPGTYTHNYMVSSVPLPATGTYTGPTVGTQFSGTYNIGGGSPMHYATLQLALADMGNSAAGNGLTGPTTLDVYSATHTGLVTVPSILGTNATNRLVIENAPAHSVVITNATGTLDTTGCGFYVNRADYVTIRGFEITGCNWGAIYIGGLGLDSCKSVYLENNYMHDNGVVVSAYNVVYMTIAADCRLTGNKIVGTANTNYWDQSKPVLRMVKVYRTRLVNNIVTSPQTTGVGSFIVTLSECAYDEWYYNTIAGYNATFVFQNELFPTGSVFSNNIFYNGGNKPYPKAAWVANDYENCLAYSDYNVFFVEGVDSGEVWPDGNPHTLAWWQTQGHDSHSYSFDPGFVSNVFPFNVHLANLPSVADSGATPLPAITTVDNDGETRNATYPDIGADEATLPYSVMLLGFCRSVAPCSGRFWDTFTYKVDYLHRNGLAPDSAWLYVDGQRIPGSDTLFLDSSRGVDYSHGVRLMAEDLLLASYGVHTYHFEVWQGSDTRRLPAAGEFTGPVIMPPLHGSYDVGGGAMNFTTLVGAVQTLRVMGMDGRVEFNVYNGTYAGGVVLVDTIPGIGEHTLIIQNAPGQTPVVMNPVGTVFSLWGVDSVTIRGFEIVDCIIGVGIGWREVTHNPLTYAYPEYDRVENNRIAASSGGIGINIYRALYTDVAANVVSGSGTGIQLHNCYEGCRVYNNMIYGCSTGVVDNYGLSQDNQWMFNSIYGSSSCCFYVAGTQHVRSFCNNVLYTNGDIHSSCFKLHHGGQAPDTSDHNDLYAPNGRILITLDDESGFEIEPFANTLADWELLTLRDAHSVSADPGFISATDLHVEIHHDVLESRGIDVSWVPTDIDGDDRRETPDIGADEYDYVPLPHRVTNLTVIWEVGGDVRLRWTATLGSVSYQVWGLSAIGGTATLLTTTTDTTYALPAASTKQFFYVIATDQTP
jgi:hypothetical protein